MIKFVKIRGSLLHVGMMRLEIIQWVAGNEDLVMTILSLCSIILILLKLIIWFIQCILKQIRKENVKERLQDFELKMKFK